MDRTERRARDGGEAAVTGGILEIPAGWIGYCRTEDGLWALTLPQPDEQGAAALLRQAAGNRAIVVTAGDALGRRLQERLQAYFSGRKVGFDDLPLDWTGYTAFTRAVLAACRKVAFGSTGTYAELARAAGRPGAARAVGNALGANRTPVVIPCHRIVRADGSIGGFTGGRDWKERLLGLERRGVYTGPRKPL